MIGITIKDTMGNETFIPHSCEFCSLDSAGNHAYDCPNRKDKDMFYVSRPVIWRTPACS